MLLNLDIPTQKFFSLRQAAQILGVSEALLRKWRRQGKLKIVKIGGCVRVDENELLKHVQYE